MNHSLVQILRMKKTRSFSSNLVVVSVKLLVQRDLYLSIKLIWWARAITLEKSMHAVKIQNMALCEINFICF